jgi:hypothetical protein
MTLWRLILQNLRFTNYPELKFVIESRYVLNQLDSMPTISHHLSYSTFCHVPPQCILFIKTIMSCNNFLTYICGGILHRSSSSSRLTLSSLFWFAPQFPHNSVAVLFCLSDHSFDLSHAIFLHKYTMFFNLVICHSIVVLAKLLFRRVLTSKHSVLTRESYTWLLVVERPHLYTLHVSSSS